MTQKLLIKTYVNICNEKKRRAVLMPSQSVGRSGPEAESGSGWPAVRGAIVVIKLVCVRACA